MKSCLVIPVYNESSRLDSNFYASFSLLDVDLVVFVDDGSSDGSRQLIDRKLDKSIKKEWVILEKNTGKSEAVRFGFLRALELGAQIIVTADADGAILVRDINLQLSKHLSHMKANSVKGILISSAARVRLSGWAIDRTTKRQWIGRVIATLVNLISELEIYDPQSPLKCYSFNSDTLTMAIKSKFKTRWFFEVELIMRLRKITLDNTVDFRILEFPIEFFRDVPGSKLKITHIFKIQLELLRLYREKRKYA